MSLQDLSQWYYLIYLLPLGFSFFMIAAAALGSAHRSGHAGPPGHGLHGHQGSAIAHGSGHAAAHAPHSPLAHSHHSSLAHGHDAGSAGHAARSDHGHSISHVIGGGHGAPSHAAHAAAHAHPASHRADDSASGDAPSEESGSNRLLSFFGVGRVPIMLLAQGFGLSWGAAGFYATRMLSSGGASPDSFVPYAAGIAAACGILGVKTIGEVGSRFMPAEETYATGREDLIGSVGVAVFPVSQTMGRIHVYDTFGTLHDESARLIPGDADAEPIAKGESVLLVLFDEEGGFFYVERSPV
jgi:hypothetical protein